MIVHDGYRTIELSVAKLSDILRIPKLESPRQDAGDKFLNETVSKNLSP